ncbi:helix-turn-helix domain-containing protein [Halobaculum sp. P14]|uniref:helix-turn-helix domain-containing protein n=1 Tax=Halobaculum sp. P14 TaxID=3421638 RepID=UPI003EB6D018
MVEPSITDRIWIVALRRPEPFTVDEIVDEAGAGERTVRQHLTVLAENGFLDRRGGRGADKVRYVRSKPVQPMEV